MTTEKAVRRRTLTRTKVIDSALTLVDTHGLEGLSMSACAGRLGVVTASLYNHVDNLDDLRVAVQVAAMTSLGEHLSLVAMGRSGPEGLRALMDAHREWSTEHPRRYHALTAASTDPDALIASAMKLNDALRAILRSCGVPAEDTFDAAATLFAGLHGFSSLVNSGFISDELHRDRVFEAVVRGALSGVTEQEPHLVNSTAGTRIAESEILPEAPIEEDYS